MSDYKPIIENGRIVDYSDGYHTFTELYQHRIALFVALCKRMDNDDHYFVWRSRLHSDGSGFEGWFLLCLECIETGEQVSYHLPNDDWSNCAFVPSRNTFGKAPSFDGHTSTDVLTRIRKL